MALTQDKDKAPTVEELQAQLAAAQEQLAAANTEKEAQAQSISELTEANSALTTKAEGLEGQVGQLESAKGALETQVAELQAKPGADKGPAKVKKTMVLVVSATEFSYDIGNNQKATPDVPVKAERYEGNLLDAQMKAGYVVEYTGD